MNHKMIYNAPAKGEDGLYFVKALNDDKRKSFVQLNGVKVSDVTEDVVLDLVSEMNTQKIADVDEKNLVAAQVTTDRIEVTRVFNAQQEKVDFEMVQPGKMCDVILEFAGLWFAKKAYGSTWNIVQVRVHDDPIIDTYPEEYAFVDETQE
jgi:hypothetical protein